MIYWLDTEFIEQGPDYPIDLISIALIAEDGREYYAINNECKFENASDWVWRNVLHPIGIYQPLKYIDPTDPDTSALTLESLRVAKSRSQIQHEIVEFIYATDFSPEPMATPEFWADYAAYDWVVFSQLFGTMMDLPKGFPMYCNDIQQECDRLGNPKLPEQAKGSHNALEDARHNKLTWKWLREFKKCQYN